MVQWHQRTHRRRISFLRRLIQTSGVSRSRQIHKKVYKTTVSNEPAGAVFIPVIARYVCPMIYTMQGCQCIKREKLSYDILKSIINLAAEGSDWLQYVFVHDKEPLTFLTRCSALPVLAFTIVTLVIQKALKQTKSANALFNFGLV